MKKIKIMENYKNIFIDQYGYVKSIYMLLIHLAGLWLPIWIAGVTRLSISGFLFIICFVLSIISGLVFIIMRLVLKFIQKYIQNIALKFALWLLTVELSGFLFYIIIARRVFDNNLNISYFSSYLRWHWDILPTSIFFYPVYATILVGFLLETYYSQSKNNVQNENILDDLDDNFLL